MLHVWCRVKSRGVIFYVKVKKALVLTFYIYIWSKNLTNVEMEICLLRGEGEGENISRQIPLRNLKVICGRSLMNHNPTFIY